MNVHITPTPTVDRIDLETAIDRARHAVALVRLALMAWRPNDADSENVLYVAVDFAEQEAGAAAAAFYAFVDGRPV